LVYTTIRIETELRDELKRLGRKGETYSEIIKRLIREAGSTVVSADEDRARIATLLPSDLG
jgi:predicted CopG family antitoxin